MKRIFSILIPAFVAVLFICPAKAQEKPKKVNEEKVIIIKKKSGGPETIITSDSVALIEINGDKIDPNDIASIRLRPRIVKGYKINNPYSYLHDRTLLGVTTKDNDKGAEVVEVTKESPASKAGIQKGDIIIKVGNTKIGNPQELSEAIRKHEPGDKVDITVIRGNKPKLLKAELSKWNDIISIATDSVFINGIDGLRTFKSLTPGQFDYNFNTPGVYFNNLRRSPSIGLQVQDTEDESGVKVLKVEPNSAAEKAGIKVGDLITYINADKITDVASTIEEMRKAKNNEYLLEITREGKPLTIKVKIPKKLRKADL